MLNNYLDRSETPTDCQTNKRKAFWTRQIEPNNKKNEEATIWIELLSGGGLKIDSIGADGKTIFELPKWAPLSGDRLNITGLKISIKNVKEEQRENI